MMVNAAYLGDGVFVQFRPDRMVLILEHTAAPSEIIELTPDVWQALLRVVKQYDDREWPFVAP
jgi:hypothetical protein